ncbi:MAG: RNB domain-containing ribonuclease [Dokdonella sp.]
MSTTRRILPVPPSAETLAPGIAAIKQEMNLPTAFPNDVEAAAKHAAANPRLPDLDYTDIAFVTIDPAGAMDLDQAMFVERHGDGYRVHYAIADVAAFVSAGDPIDLEANRRGETLYGADSKVPLHPKVLSEGAASLLPDQIRPALLWTIDLDNTGEGIAVDVRRACVMSRAKLDYETLQARIDGGDDDPMWQTLRKIGELRVEREQRRGGISLPLPEQEIRIDKGFWHLEFRARHPLDSWNEQISLLTGMAAAHLMTEAKVGILRTLPPPFEGSIARLRRTARALDIAWPEAMSYPDFIRTLDPTNPRHVAMMTNCTTVLRGAGYAAFNGTLPEQSLHSALASTYSHATAPLRRLVDRYVGETCVAICAKQPVPDWVLQALPTLPVTMGESSRRASRFEHAVIDLAEAMMLEKQVGETFTGTIVEIDKRDARNGVVMLHDLAIEAALTADVPLPLGSPVQATLVEADPATRRIRFRRSGAPSS